MKSKHPTMTFNATEEPLAPWLATLRDRKNCLEADHSAERAQGHLDETHDDEARDIAEEANADSERALHGAIDAHILAELADVNAAIGRAADGTYGYCVRCHGAIGIDRLTANPAAARCLACQESVERADRNMT